MPFRVVRVTPALQQAAAERLVSQRSEDIATAARQLVASAPNFGIDLSLTWVTIEESQRTSRLMGKPARVKVRQACLAVPGSGRTAMCFVSEPASSGEVDALATAERAACISAACKHFDAMSHDVGIAQALPDPLEAWAVSAFGAAGFHGVGTLGYLRREPGPLASPGSGSGMSGASAEFEPWPAGVELVRYDELRSRAGGSIGADRDVMRALDRSYLDTLDCPELCGLRETVDVLASHRATGSPDPTMWWVVFLKGEAEGCVLLNPCPDLQTVELVYLGLGPLLRGKGVGRRLLTMGISRARTLHPGWAVTCAVDERNVPALRLYDALGFRSFGRRVAMVRAIGRG